MHQQVVVDGTVRMRYERPCHTVDPRHSGKMLAAKHRQIGEITPRQRLTDVVGLRHENLKVVEQPFPGATHMMPSEFLFGNVGMRTAQNLQVLLKTRVKRPSRR